MAMFKVNCNEIKKFYGVFNTVKRYCSALYLSGDKATDTCVVVMPQIDIGEELKNMETLKDNLRRRKRLIEVDKLLEVWEFFSAMDNTKKSLEEKRQILFDTMKQMDSNDEKLATQREKLQTHGTILNDDIKHLRKALRSVKDDLFLSVLSLPNVLHPRTPDTNERMIQVFETKPDVKRDRSHVETAVDLNLLKYSSPYNYYLKNDAALFELCMKFHFSERLRNSGYVQFSNPDFTKSAIVEGCGLDHTNSDSVFILKHDEDTTVNQMRLHLTGGGSLLAFSAYHARHIIPSTLFPLRYFCLGRQYKPVPEDSRLGLFEVSQSSVAEIYVAVKECDEELDKELNKTLDDITKIYEGLGYHFRSRYHSAKKLSKWESVRIGFEMFSPCLNRYVEVGHISVSDNYISKRLQFCYKENKLTYYPKIISGTVLNVPKFLACIIETENALKFPDVVQNTFQ